MTVAAGYILFQFEFLLYSGRNLLEVQLHLNAQVRAAITALLLRATAAESAEPAETAAEPTAVSAEYITEHGEDVVHGHTAAEAAERSAVTGGTTHSGMAELVVTGTLVRIA